MKLVRSIAVVLLFLVSVSGGALVGLVGASRILDRPVPSELPAPALQGFKVIQQSVQNHPSYPAVAFGIAVVESQLLQSYFPNYTFVRVTTSIDRRWLLPTTRVSYSGPHVHVYAIPHSGEVPFRFSIFEKEDLNRVFSGSRILVRSTPEADLVRRLFLELDPKIVGLPAVNEGISDHEWHIAVQDNASLQCFWRVETEADGQIQCVQFCQIQTRQQN